MVFGLFEGNKISITTDKPNYKFGEEITGKVLLKINTPKNAKSLRIKVYFQYETMRQVMRTTGTPPRQTLTTETDTETVGEQVLALDGEKQYGTGYTEYPFKFVCQSINIPAGYSRLLGWFLDASLDIPMSADVSQKIRLNLY